MFGLANEVVQFLLERLPGIENCQLYQHKYLQTSDTVPPLPEPECAPVSISYYVFIRCTTSCCVKVFCQAQHSCKSSIISCMCLLKSFQLKFNRKCMVVVCTFVELEFVKFRRCFL